MIKGLLEKLGEYFARAYGNTAEARVCFVAVAMFVVIWCVIILLGGIK